MDQHFQDLLKSMNQYFPEDQHMMLQKYMWVQDPFEVQINQWIVMK